LSVQPCAICGQWAVFYLDKYDREKHHAQFLDFIEGHHNVHKDLEPLRTWAEQIAGTETLPPEPVADPAERREPEPERFRDFQHEFEPPVYLARQVADFMRTNDRGVIALTGPGGVGKSWATQGLDHAGMLPAQLGRAVPLLTVSTHGPPAPSASGVRTALEECARREKRWQGPAWPDGPEPNTRFAAWLAALMRVNGLGELIVALDGLDDLPGNSDVPDLWPPADKLPPGCYLVLSSRPGVRAAAETGLRRVQSRAEHFCELRLSPDEPEHRAVLRSYVAKRLAQPRPDGQGPLPAAWAEPLIDQAGGSFLYVFHYCRALHFGVYTDLAQLPGPAAYYPAFFDHLRGRVGDQLFHGHYARALAFIAVAREPVGLSHLEAWGVKRSDLVVILDDLADLLRTRRESWGTETLYTLGHDAIRQYLTGDKYWQSRLARANSDLAKLAVRRFGKDWSAVDPFDPVEGYLLFHLLDHASEPDLRESLLADTGLVAACEKHATALWDKREVASSVRAYHLAVRLLEDQVQRQGQTELRPDLARAYLNRGTALAVLGRPEEGLADHDTAIGLYQVIVHRDGSPEVRQQLATGYMKRGYPLRQLGRLEEALASYGNCIKLYQELMSCQDSDELHFELGIAQMNRTNALFQLGRLEEALAGCHSSISLLEESMRTVDDPELRSSLPRVYMNRGNALLQLGLLEKALADYGTCIGLLEESVRREGHLDLREDLVLAFMNRGNALMRSGRLEEALADSGTCISLCEELVLREGRGHLRKDLAKAHMNRAIALVVVGRLEEALASYRNSIDLFEELINNEGQQQVRGDLLLAYMNRSVALGRLGCLDEAVADCNSCIDLYEKWVDQEGRREFRRELAMTYMNRGNALGNLGRPEEALTDHDTSIGLYEELVSQEGRRDLRAEMALAYTNQCNALQQLGRLEEALTACSASTRLYEEMVNREGRSELRAELASAYMYRGNVLFRVARLDEALTDYFAGTGLLEELVEREGRAELVADLAQGYTLIANILLLLGQPDDACEGVQAALSILRGEITRTGRADLRKALEFAEEVARNACR
jgi:tetratricopeptide (TPR) repeat protein